MKQIGIYIHIPFCISKCYYCDFISYTKSNEEVTKYIDFLLMEMELYKDILKNYNIKTLFIGGGTPSCIDERYIFKILDYIYKNYNASNIEEITIEANPGTLNKPKLKSYKSMGINRISLGVQSLDDRLLKKIGRIHTEMDFYKNYELIRDLGFNNINVDLIFGLPDQTIYQCEKTLKDMIKLGVEHISYYSLILEDDTLLKKWYEDGKIDMPSEDKERYMYHRGIELLRDNGYEHYEISNFSKKGYRCKHNLIYWRLMPYIGLGLAAHSNLYGKRFWNYDNFKNYYKQLKNHKFPIEGEETISRDMEIFEYLMMGLRLTDGIDKNEFYQRFNISVDEIYGNVFKKHEKGGLIYMDDRFIRFTSLGLDLSNIVYVDLLP
ncbi:oxygen-independent coproporphyrinogen-3 oxidase [Keratinibaculum paraultunense]|uniref:Heme chaperone HemW n=1 Tax=Keratinibaculum paraultunense TaxID=1278232 RepID=A0A4R3KYS3_9FIRM|nr:radical SAM family heme chaperone HemW [Keratinibaculum paraultunense]QQY80458.1 oxygen-independent coproporphyrinogen III oxidase [Keratinibaculum paraultunense]TCS91176.1 oxygen-independent coproporphyrinogen-3 oxidase [Keratinibaculum paraultunense]